MGSDDHNNPLHQYQQAITEVVEEDDSSCSEIRTSRNNHRNHHKNDRKKMDIER